MKYEVTVEGKAFLIEIRGDQVIVDGLTHQVDLRRVEPLSLYSALVDNLSYELFIQEHEARCGVMLRGKLYDVDVRRERANGQIEPRTTKSVSRGEVHVDAPMPGLVLEVPAAVGQVREEGETLVVLESMKMRVQVCCPQGGVVRGVHVAPADRVAQGDLLVTLGPPEGDD